MVLAKTIRIDGANTVAAGD